MMLFLVSNSLFFSVDGLKLKDGQVAVHEQLIIKLVNALVFIDLGVLTL
jgi:hypothetical protein